jgi:chemotaxis signal transduction protein
MPLIVRTQKPHTWSEAHFAVRTPGKYLIFQLGREEFGTRVLTLREIVGIQDCHARICAPHS